MLSPFSFQQRAWDEERKEERYTGGSEGKGGNKGNQEKNGKKTKRRNRDRAKGEGRWRAKGAVKSMSRASRQEARKAGTCQGYAQLHQSALTYLWDLIHFRYFLYFLSPPKCDYIACPHPHLDVLLWPQRHREVRLHVALTETAGLALLFLIWLTSHMKCSRWASFCVVQTTHCPSDPLWFLIIYLWKEKEDVGIYGVLSPALGTLYVLTYWNPLIALQEGIIRFEHWLLPVMKNTEHASSHSPPSLLQRKVSRIASLVFSPLSLLAGNGLHYFHQNTWTSMTADLLSTPQAIYMKTFFQIKTVSSPGEIVCQLL